MGPKIEIETNTELSDIESRTDAMEADLDAAIESANND